MPVNNTNDTHKLFEWILEHKGDVNDPVPLSIIIKECSERKKIIMVDVRTWRKRMKRALSKSVGVLSDTFTMNQIIQLHFLLSIPVSEEWRIEIEKHGTLRLHAKKNTIQIYHSNDGIFSRTGRRCQEAEIETEACQIYSSNDSSSSSEEPSIPPELEISLIQRGFIQSSEEQVMMSPHPIPGIHSQDILNHLHNLIQVLKNSSLNSLDAQIVAEQKDCTKLCFVVPYKKFYETLEECLEVIFDGTQKSSSKEEEIDYKRFMDLFKFFLLAISTPSEYFTELEEVEKCKNAPSMVGVDVRRVECVLKLLLKVATSDDDG